MLNPFFKNTGPYTIKDLLKSINLNGNNFSNKQINDIKDLNTTEAGDIPFYHSKKYSTFAKLTKDSFFITTENLKSFLPNN